MAQRRDRLYYRLLAALGGTGCPICSLLLEDGRSYLDSVMYERVTDVPTREELRRSFGFCNMHTWQLADVPASSAPDMGFAIIATDLLRNFEGSIHGERVSPRGRLGNLWQAIKRQLGRTRKRAACPACLQTGASESYHLEQFLDCLGDEDFRSKYAGSPGMCLPHFSLLATQLSGHEHFTILREMQIDNARSLRNKLEQFIARQDHRSQEPLTLDHTHAWKRALEFLAGKAGTFGNELHSIRSGRRKL